MSEYYLIIFLSILATLGLFLMWGIFWFFVWKSKESITYIIQSPFVFKIIVVMGVISATAVFTLTGKLSGDIAGAIISGIVGYVLGQSSLMNKISSDSRNK